MSQQTRPTAPERHHSRAVFELPHELESYETFCTHSTYIHNIHTCAYTYMFTHMYTYYIFIYIHIDVYTLSFCTYIHN